MTGGNQGEDEVCQFIVENMESVPRPEALLQLWNSRPAKWSPEDLAKRLYIQRNAARDLLQDLNREGIIAPVAETAEQFYYRTKSPEMDGLIARVDETYRKEIVRVSTLIHSRASSAVRDFARGRRKLLLWSGLCFAGLAISNVLIFVDLILLPSIDLFSCRLAMTAVSMGMLLYGLIWESR